MGATINNKSITTETPPENGQQPMCKANVKTKKSFTWLHGYIFHLPLFLSSQRPLSAHKAKHPGKW